jgi:Ca-activated chloride channel family protein
VRIGIQGREVARSATPPRNLVFLLDVSGSMQGPDRIGLVKRGMKLLTEQLGPEDHVAMVVYAGAAGVVLEPTRGDRTAEILAAIDRLEAGGSTAGAAGIQAAYQLAKANFRKGAINRVILATDGDFNVGVSSDGEFVRMVEQERESGVFLSVLGFGRGNLQDSRMEQLADKGNGNYAYIDSYPELRKVLVEQVGGTLVTIAKDVKIQVEFNPALVASYRLIGYENRRLATRDFDDDKKDAGEIGSGHSVTALYEVVPRGEAKDGSTPLRYQEGQLTAAAQSGEMLTVKLRYKAPDGDVSKLLSFPVRDEGKNFAQASTDTRWAAAVAGYGLLLSGSDHKGTLSWAWVREAAREALGRDEKGYRAEFLGLIEAARRIQG